MSSPFCRDHGQEDGSGVDDVYGEGDKTFTLSNLGGDQIGL